MRKSRVFVWVVVCIFASACAFAKDIYVKAGADGNGTKEAPHGTLWRAMDRALRGDVIHVAMGTYDGKGGSGSFVVKIPDLTLVGGYNADFSERNPFKNFTILQRAKDYKGDWTGLPDGIVAGAENADHSGFTMDGFVLNSESRNVYYADGKLNAKKSWKGRLSNFSKANIIVRNCIMMNPYDVGIYGAWAGDKNEVSNCFFVNCFYTGISTRSAQPDSKILIKNCTVCFVWDKPGKGGGTSCFVGRLGQTILDSNIFMFNRDFAVSNTFGNEDTFLKNNVFFQCEQGYYKFMDADRKSLLIWKSSELKDLNDNAEDYMLSEAEGNSDQDPKCTPDKDYFEKYSNYVASEPGKLNMDAMNQWRRSVGLPLQAEPGSPRKNWGMAYPLSAVIPNLVSKLPGKGVQVAGPFKDYKSEAATAAKKEYKEIKFDDMKKESELSKTFKATPVQFRAGMGANHYNYVVKEAPRKDYLAVTLLKPGEGDYTRSCVYGFLLKGSKPYKEWQKLIKKKANYNQKGVVIKGTAYYTAPTYPYPVGIIIDEVKR